MEYPILVNVYRTRLYAPLLLLTLMYVLFPAVRELTVRFYNRVNIMKSRDIILLLLVVTFLSSWMVCYHGKSWGGDYSQYFAQCRALTTGTLAEWYKKNVFIINTSSEGIGSDVYPWIWPILLTPMYRIFGFNVAVLKVYECVFMAMTVIPLYCIYEKRFSKANSLLLCLLSVLNIKILIDVNTIESDIPYMLFALTAAYFIEKARERN